MWIRVFLITFTFLTQVSAAGTVRSAENPEPYLRSSHTELLSLLHKIPEK